jgi:type I restriction-modification system DNA methylase subunit
VDGFIKVITTDEAAKNDSNLSPSRYAASASVGVLRKIPEIVKELSSLDNEAIQINTDLKKILAQL